MSPNRVVTVAACAAAAALLCAPPAAAQPGAASIVRKSASLVVPVPEPGATTATRFSVRLTKPGTTRGVAGALTVSSDHRDLPPGATVLVRLRAAGPGRTTVEVVVVRRRTGAATLARGAGAAAASATVAVVAESQRRFTLRVKAGTRWHSSPLFDRPAPVCRPGSPAIRPAFTFLAGRPDPAVDPALPEGSTWSQLLPGMLCDPSPGPIGVLNPAGCAFALEDPGPDGRVALAALCASTLRELRISAPSPFTAVGQVSLAGLDGSPNPAACRLEAGAIVCPVGLTGAVGLQAVLAPPGGPVEVEIVPAASPRALYRLA